MVLCLRWSCCYACIVNDCIMGILKPLVVFFKSRHLVPCCEFFFSHLFFFLNTWPISSHLFLVFHLLSLVPSPFNHLIAMCSQFFLCVFYAHHVLLIFITHALDFFRALFMHIKCRNPSLGLATKAKGACKVASQEENLRVIPHVPKSAKECEGIDLRTPKGTPTLGVAVSVDSWMFGGQL